MVSTRAGLSYLSGQQGDLCIFEQEAHVAPSALSIPRDPIAMEATRSLINPLFTESGPFNLGLHFDANQFGIMAYFRGPELLYYMYLTILRTDRQSNRKVGRKGHSICYKVHLISKLSFHHSPISPYCNLSLIDLSTSYR